MVVRVQMGQTMINAGVEIRGSPFSSLPSCDTCADTSEISILVNSIEGLGL